VTHGVIHASFVRLAALLRAAELPPALALPLLEAALVAAGQQREQALGEGDLLGQRDADLQRPVAQEAVERRQVLDRPRRARRPHDLVASPRLRHEDSRRSDEVARHAVGAAGDRDAAHRVGQVAVEARKEAKAVLGGQVGAAAGARARDGHAARLATQVRPRLVDGHLEAALGELVGRAQARDAAAEDRHRIAHEPSLRGDAGGGLVAVRTAQARGLTRSRYRLARRFVAQVTAPKER